MPHSSQPLVRIDGARCTGCGQCVAICPSQALAIRGACAVVSAHTCLACGHCAAICPEEAAHVASLENNALDFSCLAQDERLLQPGEGDAVQLIRLMRSRRSCRHYRPDPPPRALLEDLVRAAITAPSGTNSQCWTFTMLPEREHVLALGQAVGAFFRRLNRLAARPWVRFLCSLAGKPALARYFRDHYASVADALAQWDATGRDMLFHGAPSAIMVGSRPGASCPAEDALMATQNLLLAAHALGLGACCIGYVVEAMRRDASIQRLAGIPSDETVHAVVALGYPSARFRRPAGRRTPVMRWISTG
ncbi:MAG: nitroreductase family protein [Desulfovibrionaceae bacterium]